MSSIAAVAGGLCSVLGPQSARTQQPGSPYHTRAVADIKAAALAISIEPTFVAIRDPKDFSSVSSAESWLNHQLQYDLWQVHKQRKRLRVVKFAA